MQRLNEIRAIDFLDWLLEKIDGEYNHAGFMNVYKGLKYRWNKNRRNSNVPVMSFMVNIDEFASARSWLSQNGKTLYDVKKIPESVFKEMVQQYSFEKGINFQSEVVEWHECDNLQNYLSWVFGKVSDKDYAYIQDTINRYINRECKYKCFILLEGYNSSEYEKLIHDCWNDLHYLTGDNLDVFYSERDAQKSGYEIFNEIKAIPDKLRTCIPCIILWKESIAEAKTIPLDLLTHEYIVLVIRSIVKCIENDMTFEQIVEEAGKESKVFENMQNRNINIFANGSNAKDLLHIGDTIVSNDTNTYVRASENGIAFVGDSNNVNKELIDAFNHALALINDSSSINTDESLKNELISAINEAKEAVLAGSEERKESIGQKIKDVSGKCAKVAPLLIQTLGAITQIASYFGYNPFG